jgi:hypothetical protein
MGNTALFHRRCGLRTIGFGMRSARPLAETLLLAGYEAEADITVVLRSQRSVMRVSTRVPTPDYTRRCERPR